MKTIDNSLSLTTTITYSFKQPLEFIDSIKVNHKRDGITDTSTVDAWEYKVNMFWSEVFSVIESAIENLKLLDNPPSDIVNWKYVGIFPDAFILNLQDYKNAYFIKRNGKLVTWVTFGTEMLIEKSASNKPKETGVKKDATN
jgi:hypothetical protein